MTEPATGRAETQLRTLTGHRPDIDGLRAVAVLLVVLYHAGLGFPGGFLGVDVFFVISGYLITGLLLKDLATGNFSLGQFWLRRIRRILPASCVMLVCVLLLGCWLLLPADLVELSRSSRSYLLFSANFFFWRNTGYFDGSVDLKPLLHFWSLAVEEQFYLLYPLYLMWFPPLDRRGKGLFGGLFLLCLAAGFYGHLRHPSAAFYLLPCRAWELLLGGLLWSLPVRQAMLLRPFTSLGVGVGLVSILGSALVPAAAWSRWFPPGLIACCGAAIVILAGQAQTGLCTRLLSQRLLRGIGVISYSLYLWHWPLLSFLRHVEVELQLPVGGVWYRLGCVAVALGLAIVSWKLIEQPIRKKRWFVTDRRCVWTAAVVSIVCLAASESLIQLGGLPGRFDAQVLRYAHPHGSDARFTRSMSAADVRSFAVYACGPRESARRWLLLGDSHAMCLLGGLEPLAQQAGIRIDQATRFATAPLPGLR